MRRSAKSSVGLVNLVFFSVIIGCQSAHCLARGAGGNTGPVLSRGRGAIIACVGDSITAGVGASSSATNYPSLLPFFLGLGFSVSNFGESGATLLKNGDSPYWTRYNFKVSGESNADAVVIMLGTNDSKPWNWVHKSEFASDLSALIDYYAKLPSKPKIFVCSPPPVPGSGNYGINEANVLEEIPMIMKVAQQKKAQYIDVQSVVPNDPQYFADNVHPNDVGYQYLAAAIYMGLTRSPAVLPVCNRTFDAPISVTILSPKPGLTVHYTIDGTSPSKSSPVYTNPITLSAPITVKAEAFDGKRAYGFISSTTYATASTMIH